MTHITPVSFVTFGMFIVDEIEWQTANPHPPKTNLIGGAGTYAVLGARLASSPCQLLSKSISWIVDVGSDFPRQVKDDIDSWNTDCIFRNDPTRLTTRAWNGYGEGELRAFKYLTPKVRLEVASLNERQLRSKSFHMVCSPQRCIDLTTKLSEARKDLSDPPKESPVIIWEPIPDLCSPEELQGLREAASHCTIVSPNHDELKMFFSPEITKSESQGQLVARLMGWADKTATSSGSPVLVVREGSRGSTAYFANLGPDGEPTSIHMPACLVPLDSISTLDPTGAGNTYLGALAIAMTDALDTQPTMRRVTNALDLKKPIQGSCYSLQVKTAIAMIYAHLAASFAIEQNGTPKLEQKKVFTEISEYWNGQTTIDRLQSYLDTAAPDIKDQFQNLQLS